jgi:cellulose synthase/poly-beta-1,6-N-acetylglucosamine synthase-like glycosyltransferase
MLIWRIFVLLVEFLASISVFFTVILKIKQPWTQFVAQRDGTQLPLPNTKKDLISPSRSPIKTKDTKEKTLSRTEEQSVLTYRDAKSCKAISESSGSEDEASVEVCSPFFSPVVLKERCAYVIRILVPCYKEDLDIIRNTVLSALDLEYDRDKLSVYILDDGGDLSKMDWVSKMQATGHMNLYYICRPAEFKGHGKAGNLNYTLQHVLYKDSEKNRIPRRELIAVLDADMMVFPEFLSKIVPYFSNDSRVVLVQTPQTFHNIPTNADFFDAHNVNFFQYLLPAMSSWNTTTCCGTNFLVSASALHDCGWFPTISVTEDMYLAIKLLEKKGRVLYHAEHLAVGEAPLDLRQIFQQRSRWAKGTIQILRFDNPLTNDHLDWVQRLAFFNACWSYITSAFMNPLFVVINAFGILFGLFPVRDIDFATAMLFVSYYTLFYGIIHFTPCPFQHYLSLWVVGKMGHFFSFMSLKAIMNVTFRTKVVDFKVTTKKAVQSANGPSKPLEAVDSGKRDSSHKDLVFHWVMCTFILFVICYGLFLLFGGKPILPDLRDERTILQKKGIRLFCICWMFQFLIAYSLPIWYAILPKSFSVQSLFLKFLSVLDTLLSIALIVVTICLFQVRWINTIPEIESIFQFPPSEKTFWVTEEKFHATALDYVYETATSEKIPIVILYERPDRDKGLPSEGGLESISVYRTKVLELGQALGKIQFPIVVILEPDWLMETFDATSDQQFFPVQATFDPIEFEKMSRFNQLAYIFAEFSKVIHPKSLVYIDAAHPLFHQPIGFSAIRKLRDTFQNEKMIHGLAFNVANFYTTDDVLSFGADVFSDLDLRFVIDTSRNGGEFSKRNWTEINSCRFDPPNIGYGIEPSWVEDPFFKDQGVDAFLYVKVPGESDGRLFRAGTRKPCLMYHDIECSSSCPEIPIKGIRPKECRC